MRPAFGAAVSAGRRTSAGRDARAAARPFAAPPGWRAGDAAHVARRRRTARAARVPERSSAKRLPLRKQLLKMNAQAVEAVWQAHMRPPPSRRGGSAEMIPLLLGTPMHVVYFRGPWTQKAHFQGPGHSDSIDYPRSVLGSRAVHLRLYCTPQNPLVV
jgi:hypothetical protein